MRIKSGLIPARAHNLFLCFAFVLGVSGLELRAKAQSESFPGKSLRPEPSKEGPGFESIDSALSRFRTNSKLFMGESPFKKFHVKSNKGLRSRKPLKSIGYWSSKGIPDERVFEFKSGYRCECLSVPKANGALKSSWDRYNRPEALFNDSDLIRRLDVMEKRGYQEAALPESPWSGDYFALARGALGARNFDFRFLGFYDWKSRYDYVQAYPFSKIYQEGDEDQISQLAVSEKYDLLLGDMQGGLTVNMWDQGRRYYEASGEVEGWMGICHGWAPASYRVPRPLHTVWIRGGDGEKRIKLLPSEVKGLITQQWAQNPLAAMFVGQRCQSRAPEQDENGRIVEPGCNDVNPATWHIVIVNKVARDQESFVFDATYDYEVWNQPVFAYSYKYFNPETNREVHTLAEATVKLRNFKKDKFASFRSSATEAVVGISMDVSYTVESGVSRAEEDGPESDLITTVRYLYDLEIDGQGNIVGGEWYMNLHPDFLWTPKQGEIATSPADAYIANTVWDIEKPTPLLWRKAGEFASPQGYILGPVVNQILKRSRLNR